MGHLYYKATYRWQLSPRFEPCIFWACSCRFEPCTVWRPFSSCSEQSCTPPLRPPTDSTHLQQTGLHLWHHLEARHGFILLTIHHIFFGSISYSSDKNNGCSFLFFAEVTRWCVALFLHHPVNAGDYFIAEEHIISGIQRKCHICKNNKKKQLSFWYFHFLLLAQVTIVRLISVYFVPRTLVYITRTPAYNWLTNCLS